MSETLSGAAYAIHLTNSITGAGDAEDAKWRKKSADSGCRRVCLKAYYGQPPTSNRTCTDCNTATQ
jgi:hypothetical protein